MFSFCPGMTSSLGNLNKLSGSHFSTIFKNNRSHLKTNHDAQVCLWCKRHFLSYLSSKNAKPLPIVFKVKAQPRQIHCMSRPRRAETVGLRGRAETDRQKLPWGSLEAKQLPRGLHHYITWPSLLSDHFVIPCLRLYQPCGWSHLARDAHLAHDWTETQ